MALTDEKRERIQRRIREARRLRQAHRLHPPGTVALVAFLDRLGAYAILVVCVLVAASVWREPRAMRGEPGVFLALCLAMSWLLFSVAGGLLRGSRGAFWFHVVVATYVLADIFIETVRREPYRLPEGATQTLLMHGLIMALLGVAAAGGWFRRSEQRTRLPRAEQRERLKRASRRRAQRLRLGEIT